MLGHFSILNLGGFAILNFGNFVVDRPSEASAGERTNHQG